MISAQRRRMEFLVAALAVQVTAAKGWAAAAKGRAAAATAAAVTVTAAKGWAAAAKGRAQQMHQCSQQPVR